jgi:hypothetical protein
MAEGHLKDLVKVGTETVVTDSAGNEYELYIARPSSLQQEDARKKANASVARYRIEAKDPDSDVALSLRLAFEEMDKEALVDMLLQYEKQDAQTKAYNEILWQEGSEWNEDDKYLSLVNAIADRMTDIQKYNEQMEAAGSDDRIQPFEDEQLKALLEEQKRFDDEVEQATEAELQGFRVKYEAMDLEELRDENIRQAEELEAKMRWYQEFQVRMLYYACRYSDDRKKFYFDDPEDVLELPQYVRSQLYGAYEDLEAGVGDLKNSLSLLSSSPS